MKTPMGDYFTRHGSDKNTFHSYGPIYDRLFPDREAVRAVLEIGIAEGQSIKAWHEIFPNATIVGIDREPCHMERKERMEIHHFNLRDTNRLLSTVGDRKFDLIVEDSSHEIADNLLCLFLLYPNIKPGGIYVVEEFQDIQVHQDHFALFANCELIATTGVMPGELLAVIRKPI